MSWWRAFGKSVQKLCLRKTAGARRRQTRAKGLRFEPLEARQMLALVPELVADVTAGSGSSAIGSIVGLGDTAYFTKDSSLWRSDAAGATQVVTSFESHLSPELQNTVAGKLVMAVRGTLVHSHHGAPFSEFDSYLYVSDGTSAGTVRIDSRISFAPIFEQYTSIANPLGGMYVLHDSSFFNDRILRSDGTSAGTSTVFDFPYGSGTSLTPVDLLNNRLFFTRSNAGNQTGLWATDGTSSGTALISDGTIGSGINLNGQLVFNRNGELWRSDGTSSGTVLLADLNAAATSNPATFVTIGGTAYFVANDGVNGQELWKTDGTSSGTVLVADINATGSSNPGQLLNVNGTLFFTADDGVNGVELWKSNGTSGGTTLLRNIHASGSASPDQLVTVGNRLYFTADDGVNGRELWTSDGTSSGTELVSDLNAGATGASPQSLANVNGTLYFTADNGTLGRELWRVAPSSTAINGGIYTFNGGSGANRIDLVFTSPTSMNLTVDNGPTQTLNTSQYRAFRFNLGGGNDLINVHLSSLADSVVFNGLSANVGSSNYSLIFENVETKYLFGNSLDNAVFNDAGNQEWLYALPAYAILYDTARAYTNQAIGMGKYTSQATGNNDWLLLYGDSGVQSFQSSPTATSVTAGNVAISGQGYRTVVVNGMGGNDSLVYSGTAANELLTSLEQFSVVASSETTQYFVSVPNIDATSGGGTDTAVMYDTAGNDTFTASAGNVPSASNFQFTGLGMNRIARGYTKAYAWSYFGGSDTANISTSPGLTNWYGNENYLYMTFDTQVVQALQFRTVNANGLTFNNNLLLDDSAGNDTLSIPSTTATMSYASGRTINATGMTNVIARGINGGQNRRITSQVHTFMQVTYVGSWI